jgi:hypothetical protein
MPAGDGSRSAKAIYHSKNDASSKTFAALDWLAQLNTHIPNRGEQMCRYYGLLFKQITGHEKEAGIS